MNAAVNTDPVAFAAAVAKYVENARAIRRASHDRNGFKYGPGDIHEFDIVAEKPGPRFIRVVTFEPRQNEETKQRELQRASVYSFIERSTGNVFKPASFKAPAKHARGNIFSPAAGTENHSAYGPAYLR